MSLLYVLVEGRFARIFSTLEEAMRSARHALSFARAILVGANVALGAGACAASAPPPALDLSAELDPTQRLQQLSLRWERGDLSDSVGFIASLEAHANAFPRDPSTRRVRSWMAVLLVEQERPDDARAAAESVRATLRPEEAPGAADDAAAIVLGAVSRRAGDPAAAFSALEPLFNRVIDVRARTLLNEELFLLAVELGKNDAAATYLRAWVTQAAGPLRARVEERASATVHRVPAAFLLELLADETSAPKRDRWLSTFLARHLAKESLRVGDSETARALLRLVPQLIGRDADALLRVAARGAEIRLERNTVGLVMPMRTDALRARGLDVARGLSASLGLPGGETKLVIRDHRGDASTLDDTLSLLNADGAAVIIAGFDPEDSDQAVRYAERTSVPVVLLVQPTRPVPSSASVFVIGEDPAVVRSVLVQAAVARGSRRVALLTDDRRVLDFSAAVAERIVAEQPCDAAGDLLATVKADALVVDGETSCGRHLALSPKLLVARGLRAGLPADAELAAAAGRFPWTSAARSGDDALAALEEGRDDVAVNWWTALGHDAGQLVKGAILGLPDGDERSVLVAVRKRIVTDAIASAEVELWTTSSKGFEGGRTLARPLRVVSGR